MLPRTMKTKTVLKLLTFFMVAVSLSNFLYNLTYPVPLPLSRRINLHRRHSEIEKRGEHVNKFVKRVIARRFNKVPLNKRKTDKFIGSIANKHPLERETKRETERKVVDLKDYEEPIKCRDIGPYLGPNYWRTLERAESMDELYSLLDPGGSYLALGCVPQDVVAVVIPFSGRGEPLPVFLFSLHLFLLNQPVAYQIFVVKDQKETAQFKPGMLSNIGFLEAQKIQQNFTCVIFHDPYLAPKDPHNLYECSKQPRQLVASIDNVPYKHVLGGVVAIRPEDFLAVNGFSNMYNDSESVYLDMYDRLMAANLTIDNPDQAYAIYESLLGIEPRVTSETPVFITTPVADSTTSAFWDDDGLSSLINVSRLVKISKAQRTYTLVEV